MSSGEKKIKPTHTTSTTPTAQPRQGGRASAPGSTNNSPRVSAASGRGRGDGPTRGGGGGGVRATVGSGSGESSDGASITGRYLDLKSYGPAATRTGSGITLQSQGRLPSLSTISTSTTNTTTTSGSGVLFVPKSSVAREVPLKTIEKAPPLTQVKTESKNTVQLQLQRGKSARGFSSVPSASQQARVDSGKKPAPTSGPVKNKRVYSKNSIAPTSVQMGIDPTDFAHPVTVPFLDPKKKLEFETKKEDISGIKEEDEKDPMVEDMYRAKIQTSKYSQKLIETSISESLFRNEQKQYSGEDDLFFIQLPTILPMRPTVEPKPPPTPSTTTTAVASSTTTDKSKIQPEADTLQPWGYKNNLGQIPRGRIGKLYILKSGKVKMKIGDVVYDIAQGMPVGFLQELVSIDLKKSRLSALGDVHKRMVAYPDVASLVKGGGAQK